MAGCHYSRGYDPILAGNNVCVDKEQEEIE